MSTTSNTTATRLDSNHDGAARRVASSETKPAFKTTELIVYVVAVLAVLIASLVVDKAEDGQSFGPAQAWLYVTLLSVGYMISRGLAKSGSRGNRDA